MIRWTVFETPFGDTFLAATPKGLVRLSWQVEDPGAEAERLREEFPLWGVKRAAERLSEPAEEIVEYFCGQRRSFTLDVDLTGVTEFQARVLEAAGEVPFGDRVSYGELARRIERPRASRAVGSALGKNPVPIVVPCHRVVRSDGTLGGYTAGTGYKEQLLELESRG
jgi:methylated-DNA-[protein]-cysteine S-methyltransferase